MIPLADHPLLRLAFLCLLYAGQGIPYGFVTVALAAHLAAGGATAAEIGGVIAMAVLPWSFKWAWGPVIDSGRLAWLGRRRPWLILAQALMIATAAAIALVPDTDVATLGWVILLHNVFVGLQDVAGDALAVDQLQGADRERASGMMFGSAYVGTFLGGAGLGIVTARLGLPTAVAAMTVAQAAILAVVMVVREQPPATAATAVLESRRGGRRSWPASRWAWPGSPSASRLGGGIARTSSLASSPPRPSALRPPRCRSSPTSCGSPRRPSPPPSSRPRWRS